MSTGDSRSWGGLIGRALAGGVLLRITLTADGRRAQSVERLYPGRFGRIRDVLVGPDGAVYIATSNRDGRGSPAPGAELRQRA